MAGLEYLRDADYPYYLQRLNRRAEVMLMSYSARSVKNAQEAKETLFSVQNSRKARIGGLAGLLDPEFITLKQNQEAKLKAAAKDDSFQGRLAVGPASPRPALKVLLPGKPRGSRYTLLGARLGVQHASCSASHGRCFAAGRNDLSPTTANGCRSSSSPAWNRWNFSYSPRRPFTRSSRSSS